MNVSSSQNYNELNMLLPRLEKVDKIASPNICNFINQLFDPVFQNKLANIPEFKVRVDDNIFRGKRYFTPWIYELLLLNPICCNYIKSGILTVRQSICSDSVLDTSRLLCTIFEDSSESSSSDFKYNSICLIRGYAETTLLFLFNSRNINDTADLFDIDYTFVIFSNLAPPLYSAAFRSLITALSSVVKDNIMTVSFFLSLPPWNNLGHYMWNIFNSLEKYKKFSFFEQVYLNGFNVEISSCKEGQYIDPLLINQTFVHDHINSSSGVSIADESDLTCSTNLLFPIDSMIFNFGTRARASDLKNYSIKGFDSCFFSRLKNMRHSFALGIKGSSRQVQVDDQIIISRQIISTVSRLIGTESVNLIVDGVTRPVGNSKTHLSAFNKFLEIEKEMFCTLLEQVSDINNVTLTFIGGLSLIEKFSILSHVSSYSAFPGSVCATASAMFLPSIHLNVGTQPLLGDELPLIRWGSKEIPECLRYIPSVNYPQAHSSFSQLISDSVSKWIVANF